jgi:translation initiation factor 2B subunit (eIF-2B alpha/beta/delta family)
MLVELKKLNIANDGYARKISIDNIYINSSHIISIKDYEEVRQFLITDGHSDLSKNKFSIIKITNGDNTEEIITLGTSSEVFSLIQDSAKKQKRLLNG